MKCPVFVFVFCFPKMRLSSLHIQRGLCLDRSCLHVFMWLVSMSYMDGRFVNTIRMCFLMNSFRKGIRLVLSIKE